METISISSPAWLSEYLAGRPEMFPDRHQKLELVIDLAARNVANKSGGPFAAAVFRLDDHRLLAAGLNLVLTANTSLAHAEMVALARAQQAAASHDLSSLAPCQLVSSAQPCVMCYGALFWSGIHSLLFAATSRDVESITGFREGPLPRDWRRRLQQAGIEVQGRLLRKKAARVLGAYRDSGGFIYNPGN